MATDPAFANPTRPVEPQAALEPGLLSISPSVPFSTPRSTSSLTDSAQFHSAPSNGITSAAGVGVSALYRTEIARLTVEISALRLELARQQRREQSIIDHYERVLETRNRALSERNTEQETDDSGLFDRFLP